MRRKLPFAATLLLLISFSISALLYVFYDIAQLQSKMEARRDIEVTGNLQTVRLSAAEFNKNKKDDNELWINGKLYDISSYVVINDSVLVSVYHDEWEEGLVKSIADSFEPNDHYTSDNIIHLNKHRIHLPDDGKVLVRGYSTTISFPIDLNRSLAEATKYRSQLFSSVIKPPPRPSFLA